MTVINLEHTPNTSGDANQTVTRSAFKVMTGSLFSLVTGLVSQILIAALFGAGAEMDAYLTALVVPIYLQAVLLSGLSFVFIPAFIQEEEKGNKEDAWALAGTFFWLTAGVLAVASIACLFFSEDIVAMIAPGLNLYKAELTSGMLAILIFSLPLSGLSSLTAGIQNARNRFFWPAVAPAIGSLFNILILLFLYKSLGPFALAWGFVASETVKACITIAPVLRHGWNRKMPVSDRRVREIAKLITPFILFGIFTRADTLFERFYASALPDGELSYLGYGYKVSGIVVAILGYGIATAVFPAMARAYAQNGTAGLATKTMYGIQLSLAVALPALAILSATSLPLVVVLFERGAFDHNTSLYVSRIVPIVILGSVAFLMIHNIVRRTFYVTKDTITVPIVDSVFFIFYVLVAKKFAEVWGYVGLAGAMALYTGLDVLVLILLLGRRIKELPIAKITNRLIVYGLISLVAFIIAWLISTSLSFLPAYIQLLFSISIAGLSYIAIIYRVDREIAVSVLEMTGVLRIYKHGKGLVQ